MWYARLDIEALLARRGSEFKPVKLKPTERLLTKARSRDSMSALSKLHTYRRSLEPDRQVLFDRFQLTDFARKVVGVGSVGTRAWIGLFVDRDGKDPLFLQLKEAEASVLEEHLGASSFANHGQRVVTGQRLMQSASDIFLGWLHVASDPDDQERHYYGRQLKDWKGSRDRSDDPTRLGALRQAVGLDARSCPRPLR